MIKVVDSSGWLHYFMNGPLAERYAHLLSDHPSIVTPTIVVYEVYRRLKQKLGQEIASTCVADLERTQVVDLNSSIALLAAGLSLKYKLATADALVYATASTYHLKLVTSDADFKDLPNVEYIPAAEHDS